MVSDLLFARMLVPSTLLTAIIIAPLHQREGERNGPQACWVRRDECPQGVSPPPPQASTASMANVERSARAGRRRRDICGAGARNVGTSPWNRHLEPSPSQTALPLLRKWSVAACESGASRLAKV